MKIRKSHITRYTITGKQKDKGSAWRFVTRHKLEVIRFGTDFTQWDLDNFKLIAEREETVSTS